MIEHIASKSVVVVHVLLVEIKTALMVRTLVFTQLPLVKILGVKVAVAAVVVILNLVQEVLYHVLVLLVVLVVVVHNVMGLVVMEHLVKEMAVVLAVTDQPAVMEVVAVDSVLVEQKV
jgi:hypothetical protein